MTITIQPTRDYLLHFTVKPVDKDFNLKIESQWWGAEDRNGLQTKFDVTLPGHELKQLALAIDAGIKS
jgi:hypothetical protein